MSTQTLIIIVAICVLILLALGAWLWRRRRSTALRGRFGPEYDRAVEDAGNPAKAEHELADRARRVAHYDLKPLSTDELRRFRAEWNLVQARFVDDPKDATAQADGLLQQVMTARGYPDGSFDQRLEDLSVDHAQAVQGYRAAHETALKRARGEAGTEDMRVALIHYRTLFEDLVGEAPANELKAAS